MVDAATRHETCQSWHKCQIIRLTTGVRRHRRTGVLSLGSQLEGEDAADDKSDDDEQSDEETTAAAQEAEQSHSEDDEEVAIPSNFQEEEESKGEEEEKEEEDEGEIIPASSPEESTPVVVAPTRPKCIRRAQVFVVTRCWRYNEPRRSYDAQEGEETKGVYGRSQ
ncbi:unnamed protein product [Discula destructiva]